MNLLQLSMPTSLQNEDQQLAATQGALTQIQAVGNQNASTPLCILYQSSETDNANASTNSGSSSQIPGYSWNINSQGGLVQFQASLSTAGDGAVSLVIDGATVLKLGANGTPGNIGINYSAVLGAGPHTIALQFDATSGNFQINPSGYSSVSSLIELPENVSTAAS